MNNMDKLDLKDASDEQVRTFARVFLQIPEADSEAIKKVRALVTAAWPQGFIWVAKAIETVQAQAGAVAAPPTLTKEQIEARAGNSIAPSSSKTDPVVMLTIAKTNDPGGKDPVFVNVNGNAMHVARGILQAVPYRFFFDLKQAVQRIHNWDERENIYSHEDVSRFPMNVQKFPTEDEIFAFMHLDATRSGQEYTREMFEAHKPELMAA